MLVEPLFNQWYAWSYLISPATAAMYIANLHLKIMESFVAAPQMHQAALKNPANLGGPFMNYDASRVGEVRALRERTAGQFEQSLRLAEAVKTLDNILAEEATGLSLEPLYQKVPEALRGYVELVYDLNNHPAMRFVEPLLYRSPFYDPTAQSVTLKSAEEDARPFVFSTPRLDGRDSLHLRVPFSHGGLDELFRMKETPQTFGFIKGQLGVADGDDELLARLFTEEQPPPRPAFDGAGVRVRYFGHACVLVESARVSILCDPVIAYAGAGDVPRYTYADLPDKIDYVLLTHNHQDHCMFETLLQLRHKIGTVVVPRNGGGSLADPSLKLILRNVGFERVLELDELESVEVDGGQITGVPFLGEHADLNVRTKLAYFIALEGHTVMCVADSNNVEPRLYEHVRQLLGDVDVLFVGMECDGAPLSWLYGPLLTKPLARKMDQSRRADGSDFRKAMNLVEQFRPRQVYVYAMGQEPWLTYLTSIQYTAESRPIVESDKLVGECHDRGLTAERLYGRKEIYLAPR